MSNFIRATVIGVDFKDLEHPPLSEVIYADVVLIDRSQISEAPYLYCLKEEDFSEEGSILNAQGFSPIDDTSFTMLGSIESINKEKKIIQLKNHKAPEHTGTHTLVSYKHLIVASDLNHALLKPTSHDEFSAGLTALIDAIKMRKNIPEAFSSFEKEFTASDKKTHLINPGFEKAEGLGGKSIEEIVHSLIPNPTSKDNSINLASLYKKLYEVQLGQ